MQYWKSVAELTRDFTRHGIPTDRPGFYDDPAFQSLERTDSDWLNAYASFVARRPYTADYVQRSRREVPFIAMQFRAALAAEGTLGACVDASMALSRILDREGFWNFCVMGGLRIEYPPDAGLQPSTFFHVDFGNHAAGHAWIHVPPFELLDITVQLQEYERGEAQFLPVILLGESVQRATQRPVTIVASPAARASRAADGVCERDFLDRGHPSWREFTRSFPPRLATHNATRLSYVPYGIGASDMPLERITNRSYQGRLAFEVYSNMQPALAAFRASSPGAHASGGATER